MTTPGSFFGYGTRLRQGVLTPDPNENYVSWGVTANSTWQQHSAGTYYWRPPRGLVALTATFASGGAGGGSGRLDAAGTIRCGGGGGGGGSGGRFHIPMTPDLFGVWTIVVGAGGAGGAARTGAAASGANGAAGGITTISPPVTAFMPDGAFVAVSVGGTIASQVGGGGGSGVAGGAGAAVSQQLLGGSGSASIAAGTAASSAPMSQSTQTAGGGGGGGLTALNAESTAAAPTFWSIMPTQPSMMTAKNLLPAITGAASLLNGQTSRRAPTFGGPGYSGQGGGGRAAAAAAGDGANGTAGAGGGGGGGGTTGGGSSGKGGDGGDGYVHFQLWW